MDLRSRHKEFSTILDNWIERFLWTRDDIDQVYLKSGRGSQDKARAFKNYYRRLSDARYEEWVAEFLFRSEEFRKDYIAYLKLVGKRAQTDRLYALCKKYQAWLSIGGTVKQYGVRVGVVLLPRAVALRVFPEGAAQDQLRLNKKTKGQLSSRHWNHTYFSCLGPKLDPKEIVTLLLGNRDSNGRHLNCDNALLIAVDLSFPDTRIKESIDEILKIHLEGNQAKNPRPKNWMLYLMAYDLHGLRIKPLRIAAFLQDIYEEECSDTTKYQVERNKKYMQSLIDGGYKKYI